MRPAAIVLAAGLGSRFGGAKLLGSLEGRPILQHVLDSLARAGIDDPVVVIGPGAAKLESRIEWRSTRRVINPDPAEGLSSSLRIGWDAAMSEARGPTSAIILLGDQPLVDPAVIGQLAEAPLDPARPIVVARHADGSRNPVRVEREAASLVTAAAGDRGLGPLIDSRPELVRTIEVDGANPDVDERRDLVALLEARWTNRVRGNAEQVDESAKRRTGLTSTRR